MKLFEIYKKNKYIHLPFFRLLSTKAYLSAINLFRESENWSSEEMDQWQFSQVKAIVDYAYDFVPYYRKIYSEIGFKPGDLKTWDDFQKLPYVKKDDIKNNFEKFTSSQIETIQYFPCFTGGSTDKPMKFFLDQVIAERETAFFDYYWEKYGYKKGERCLILRGHKVADISKNRFYEYDKYRNYKILDSSFITKSEYLHYYDKEIRDFSARVIQAYPSSLFNLAKTYEAVGMTPPKIELIFLGSENTYPGQLDYLKKMFRAKRVMYHYGHSECVVVALKYPDSNHLGFFPQYGRMELINEKGSLIKGKGILGEIIGTSFNKSMPFIRYRTGDYAHYSDCNNIGFMKNCISVARIDGRLHEFVVTKDGRLVSLVVIAGSHLPSLSFIGDMQYEQIRSGHLIVKVTSKDGKKISQFILDNILSDFRNLFNETMEVQVYQIPEIKRTSLGKKILLKQELDIIAIRKSIID